MIKTSVTVLENDLKIALMKAFIAGEETQRKNYHLSVSDRAPIAANKCNELLNELTLPSLLRSETNNLDNG